MAQHILMGKYDLKLVINTLTHFTINFLAVFLEVVGFCCCSRAEREWLAQRHPDDFMPKNHHLPVSSPGLWTTASNPVVFFCCLEGCCCSFNSSSLELNVAFMQCMSFLWCHYYNYKFTCKFYFVLVHCHPSPESDCKISSKLCLEKLEDLLK